MHWWQPKTIDSSTAVLTLPPGYAWVTVCLPEKGGRLPLDQQLAKNLYPRKHYGIPGLSLLINKIRENYISRQAGKNLLQARIAQPIPQYCSVWRRYLWHQCSIQALFWKKSQGTEPRSGRYTHR